jgi:hypothetical protein
MRRSLTALAAAIVLGMLVATPARAQFIQVYSSPVVTPAPVMSYYAPITYPTVSYYTPVTSYYAPSVTSYYAPVSSYSYYPTTAFYPSATVYSAPATVVTPGVVTTRSYVGYGVFRPRGVYTQNYFTPAPVMAPTTTYYSPVFIR